MSNKTKGSKAERELVALFSEHGWRAARVAGSGINDDSPCDLIAGKLGRKGYVVEVKSSKGPYIYIKKNQIEDFILFAQMIGLKACIAVRFNRNGWFFLEPDVLQNSGLNLTVSLDTAKKFGKRFGQFF